MQPCMSSLLPRFFFYSSQCSWGLYVLCVKAITILQWKKIIIHFKVNSSPKFQQIHVLCPARLVFHLYSRLFISAPALFLSSFSFQVLLRNFRPPNGFGWMDSIIPEIFCHQISPLCAYFFFHVLFFRFFSRELFCPLDHLRNFCLAIFLHSNHSSVPLICTW